MTLDKVRPMCGKQYHPDFHKLLIKLQEVRIKKGTDSVQDKVALWRLTKTIYNMIDSNKELFDILTEVPIKNV
jgi:hypothetical protein